MPLAPGRFSTTSCWPRRSPTLGAMRRDMMSIVSPGGNGTIRRTGLVGQDCAFPRVKCNASNNPETHFISILRNDRQENERLLVEMQRHLAAEHRRRPVGRVIVREGAAALHRVLHVRERRRLAFVLVVAAADAERDAIAGGHH